jgi:hypothetical protein
MILSLNNDLVEIKCMYWKLMNKTNSFHHRHYTWIWNNDTHDDCSCKMRQAQCVFKSHANESIVVSDQLCDSKLRPRPLKCTINTCSDQSPFAPRWQVGIWRTCEGRCWPNEAIQRRSLLCVRILLNNRTHTIPNSICLHWFGYIPMTVRHCPVNLSSTIPKCTAMKTYSRWNTSEWHGVRIFLYSSNVNVDWRESNRFLRF